ncbi:MAG TPA: hybrid sensor histidine kinase/response regulator [Chloroflexia bacterium]|nr:hybrid sensor histidine kinase/response regulator [Chloroflexia bacterium]
MGTFRVLVVDDDPFMLHAIPKMLAAYMEDLAVDTAQGAAAALAQASQTDYDAIISDIKMPEMDGLELLVQLRAQAPDTPMLLMTAYDEPETAIQALRGGAYDFIHKPLDREYLVASLGRALQVRQLRRQVAAQQAALERHAAELESMVEERTREAQQALRIRDHFLSIAAHELKTPMTSILGAAQLLQRRDAADGFLNPRDVRTLRILVQQTLRLHRLIISLLDLSRLQTGQLTIERQVVDLAALARRVVEEMGTAFERHTLTTSIPENPLLVTGDELRLEQVLYNLLQNAIKYSPRGGALAVRVAAEERLATISVTDHGIGIPAAAQPRLFTRFYRAENAAAPGISGMGVGLYVVREIMTLHGGRVEVASVEGQGSTFTVWLPLRRGTPAGA